MKKSISLCKKLNALFPLPVHPFNLSNDQKMTYAQWQFEKGLDTIKFYLHKTTTKDMFEDKIVLDVGCGAGGKTIFYGTHKVKAIYGLEILGKYKEEAEKLAKEKGLENLFTFICEDASKMHFSDGFFDAIIMNDAMEHVDHPEAVLAECYRVLKPGGRLYLNFPPYNHPYGAHLSDVMGFPWIHRFFSEKTLIEVYKDLVKDKPDGKERIEFRISQDASGKEYFSYINEMTIKRFQRILTNSSFETFYYHEVPLRKQLSFLAKLPILKEFFVKMVVCILQK
ncbi:MAG: class I SAM-dependent methyltransferase [Vallitaleaceae bacterium]|nr:class I SAM-dependent methyltransferase [Vallitaleaceae bacterium]